MSENIGSKILYVIVDTGQGNSQLIEHLLRDTLKARRAEVEQQQIQKILEFVKQICPWFPEHGTLEPDTRARIGVKNPTTL